VGFVLITGVNINTNAMSCSCLTYMRRIVKPHTLLKPCRLINRFWRFGWVCRLLKDQASKSSWPSWTKYIESLSAQHHMNNLEFSGIYFGRLELREGSTIIRQWVEFCTAQFFYVPVHQTKRHNVQTTIVGFLHVVKL